ncbi:endonuclease/exonuclease/phosphatase family protein, partial [Streptomyces lavendulocolor]
LLDRLAALAAPHAIAAGDLNARPDGRAFGRLAAGLQDCWAVRPGGGEHTWTPGDPYQRIDAVFATKGLEVLGCGVPRPQDLPGVTEADLRAA